MANGNDETFMISAAASPQIASARPQMTAAIAAETGLDEDVLRNLVHGFYGRVRCDSLLGPVFAAHIADWGAHLDRMVAFWSSVALMTGRYHGRLVPKHSALAIDASHFDRWLALFCQTAHEVCSAAGAIHVIERAERIALSLHTAVQEAHPAPDAVPASAEDRMLR